MEHQCKTNRRPKVEPFLSKGCIYLLPHVSWDHAPSSIWIQTAVVNPATTVRESQKEKCTSNSQIYTLTNPQAVLCKPTYAEPCYLWMKDFTMSLIGLCRFLSCLTECSFSCRPTIWYWEGYPMCLLHSSALELIRVTFCNLALCINGRWLNCLCSIPFLE